MAASFTGPTSPYYVINNNNSALYIVQGPTVINSFPVTAHGGNLNYQQSSLAVGTTVNTHGIIADVGDRLAGQYSLTGAPTGTSYVSYPLTPRFITEESFDGTSDGTHNYYVQQFAIPTGGNRFSGPYAQNVVQTDLNWQNPSVLFSVEPPVRFGGDRWLGISYDSLNNSLWLSGWSGNNQIRNYSMTGTLLSSFTTPLSDLAALGFDAADNTLWATQHSTETLYFNSQPLARFCKPVFRMDCPRRVAIWAASSNSHAHRRRSPPRSRCSA